LYGVILKQRDKVKQSQEVLVKAINKFPLLWSAWQELSLLLKKNDKQIFKNIKNHWIKNFFYSSFFITIQQEDDSCLVNSKLIDTFKNSVYLINEIANACYLNQNFDHALEMFKKLKKIDPF
jgi:anaphase-promoting complex subunit 8